MPKTIANKKTAAKKTVAKKKAAKKKIGKEVAKKTVFAGNKTNDDGEPRRTVTLVLSGGAPNCTLMSGFLYGVHKRGRTFDNFYTSGAGATIALLYLAGRDLTPLKAMKATKQAGISDSIWNTVPIAYKSFFKNSPFTVPFLGLAQLLKIPKKFAGSRLYNDAVDFWATTLTPSTTTMASTGVCAHYPFVKQLMDFDKLRKFKGKFFMNAYNITKQQMEEFDKEQTDTSHFWAALAFPFVYEPVAIDRCEICACTIPCEGCDMVPNYYSEGSDRDPINFPNLHAQVKQNWGDCMCSGLNEENKDKAIEPDTRVILLDVLGSLEKGLIRKPRNFMDAFSIMILTPIVSLALKQKHHFLDINQESDPAKLRILGIIRPSNLIKKIRGKKASTGGTTAWKPAFETYEEVNFLDRISKKKLPFIADWSKSNMDYLFKVGVKAGKAFADTHATNLPKIEDALPPDSP